MDFTDVVEDAAGRDDLWRHVHVNLLQETPPTSSQASEGSVHHRQTRRQGEGEAALLRGQLLLAAVAFHQPRLQGEGDVTDQMDWDLHVVTQQRPLQEIRVKGNN